MKRHLSDSLAYLHQFLVKTRFNPLKHPHIYRRRRLISFHNNVIMGYISNGTVTYIVTFVSSRFVGTGNLVVLSDLTSLSLPDGVQNVKIPAFINSYRSPCQ